MQKISQNYLKWIKTLHQKKNRDQERCFLVEGIKICHEVITHHPERIKSIICTSDYCPEVPENQEALIHTISPSDLTRISTLKTPNAILLVLKKEEEKSFDPLKKVIILDDIQDPGNLGTLIRTADWFGINQFVCSQKTVDLFNPKTLQSTMGSFLRVKIWYTDLEDFINLHDLHIGGAVLDGTPFDSKDLQEMNGIILGNESRGVSEKIKPYIDKPLKIQGSGQAESLNVAIAGAIFMQHWTK